MLDAAKKSLLERRETRIRRKKGKDGEGKGAGGRKIIKVNKIVTKKVSEASWTEE